MAGRPGRRSAAQAATVRLYYVYVVELSAEAGERIDSRKPIVYVGQSAVHPTIRFQQHKDGYRSSKWVRLYGVRLKPRLYRNRNPLHSRQDAENAEARLARHLTRRGYRVFGGH